MVCNMMVTEDFERIQNLKDSAKCSSFATLTIKCEKEQSGKTRSVISNTAK